MLGNWAHEGPRPPSNMEERKGLKEAQHAAHSHPPRTRGVISASLEGSHRDPRLRPASPPRSRAANLPRAGDSSPPRSRPPLGVRDKRPRRSTARRMEALNATHSSTVLRTGDDKPPFPTVAVTGVPSVNSGHCSAIPDAL